MSADRTASQSSPANVVGRPKAVANFALTCAGRLGHREIDENLTGLRFLAYFWALDDADSVAADRGLDTTLDLAECRDDLPSHLK